MKKINKIFALGLAAGLSMASLSASADLNDQVESALNNNGAKAQIETSLNDIAKNMAAIFAHRSLAPAETLGGGVGGFEVGLNLAMVDLDTQPLKDLVALGGNNLESEYDIASIPVPALSAGAGLPVIPLDFSVTYLPVGGIDLLTAELKYALLSGGLALPAVSVSANYTSATLADTFDVSSYGADVSISKGFGVGVKLIPFAGAGYVSSSMEINNRAKPAATSIKTSYDNTATKLFAGAAVQLGVFNIVGQWDRIGDYSAVSAKLGIRF